MNNFFGECVFFEVLLMATKPKYFQSLMLVHSFRSSQELEKSVFNFLRVGEKTFKSDFRSFRQNIFQGYFQGLNLFAFNSKTAYIHVKQVALLGFLPTTLCRGRNLNSRQ